MAQIYLVRHTTPDIAKGICYGASNLLVSKTFASESALIKRKLEGINFDLVYCSPLLRCTILADYLYPENYLIDPLLTELHFGLWEMKSWDEIFHSAYGKDWMNDYLHLSCPEGESYPDLQNRIKKFIALNLSPLSTVKEKNILIITHAGPIRVFLSFYGGITIEETFIKKDVNYGEVIKLTV